MTNKLQNPSTSSGQAPSTGSGQGGSASLLALLVVLLFVIAFAVSSYLGLWDKVLPSFGLKQNLEQYISPKSDESVSTQTLDELKGELDLLNTEDLETDFKEVDADITNL